MNVWCIKCDRLKPEEEVDIDSRLCVTCRGADIPPADRSAPLTDEERAIEIVIDVDASASWKMTAREGWSPAEWRDLIDSVEDKTVDKDELVDDIIWDFYDVHISLRRPK